MDAATPSREALWNIEGSWLVYPCFLLVLVVAAYFFWRRYRLWKIGRPLERGDRPLERLKGAFVDALLQVTVVKERGVGIAHLGMYVGMAVMVVATASYAVQVDLGLDIAKGDYYLYVLALGTDIAGLAFCIAMVACIVRRGEAGRHRCPGMAAGHRRHGLRRGGAAHRGYERSVGRVVAHRQSVRAAVRRLERRPGVDGAPGSMVVPYGHRLRDPGVLDVLEARARAAGPGHRVLPSA